MRWRRELKWNFALSELPRIDIIKIGDFFLVSWFFIFSTRIKEPSLPTSFTSTSILHVLVFAYLLNGGNMLYQMSENANKSAV